LLAIGIDADVRAGVTVAVPQQDGLAFLCELFAVVQLNLETVCAGRDSQRVAASLARRGLVALARRDVHQRNRPVAQLIRWRSVEDAGDCSTNRRTPRGHGLRLG